MRKSTTNGRRKKRATMILLSPVTKKEHIEMIKKRFALSNPSWWIFPEEKENNKNGQKEDQENI